MEHENSGELMQNKKIQSETQPNGGRSHNLNEKREKATAEYGAGVELGVLSAVSGTNIDDLESISMHARTQVLTAEDGVSGEFAKSSSVQDEKNSDGQQNEGPSRKRRPNGRSESVTAEDDAEQWLAEARGYDDDAEIRPFSGKKIRIGRDYQAECPPLLPENERIREDLDERAELIWSPMNASKYEYLDLDEIAATIKANGLPAELLNNVTVKVAKLMQQVQEERQAISKLKQGNSVSLAAEGLPHIKVSWSYEEALLLLHGMCKYGNDFETISEIIGTKTEEQLRAFFEYCGEENLKKELEKLEREKDAAAKASNVNANKKNDSKEEDNATSAITGAAGNTDAAATIGEDLML